MGVKKKLAIMAAVCAPVVTGGMAFAAVSSADTPSTTNTPGITAPQGTGGSPSTNASQGSSTQSGAADGTGAQSTNAAESDTDAGAQAAACQKAGVTGTNVQYDDTTGVCSADAGSGTQANN